MRKAIRYLQYLEDSNHPEQDSIKVLEYLKPCVRLGDHRAQLLMARLYLNSIDEKNIKKGFKLTKKAAKQDDGLAAHDLGVLYKYGKGERQNLKKAVKWFKKSHELGNTKAAYSIGYMHLKGFGDLEQNYKKAVRWFKKSEYSMAKHWLAVCHYFGYGVPQNKAKAIKILEENSIENSEMLLSSLENYSEETKLEEDEVHLLNELNNTDDNKASNEEIEINDLHGTWVGSLIQLDWSRSKVMQKIPVSLNFVKDSVLDDITYKLSLNDKQYNGEVHIIGNMIYLEDLTLDLEHP